MGIKGLWTHLKNEVSENTSNFEEEIHQNDTLLIDATSFFFTVLELYCLKNFTNIKFHLLSTSLGSYNLIKNVIRNELINLTSLKLNLIFYFDGNTETVFKEFTKQKREKGINEKWVSLTDYFLKDSFKYADSIMSDPLEELSEVTITDQDKVSISKFPLPPMWRHELLTLLINLKIPIKYCEFEADQEMAIDCFNFNYHQISYAKVSHILNHVNNKKYASEYLIVEAEDGSEKKKLVHSMVASQLYRKDFYSLLAIDPYSLSHSHENHYPHRDNFYCYSEDSDFLLMKTIPLIKIGSFLSLYEDKLIMDNIKDNDEENFDAEKKNINAFLKKNDVKQLEEEISKINFEDSSVSSSTVSTPVYKIIVWRRKKIADLYGMSERQLIEVCLVVGNDYTVSYPLEKLFFQGFSLKKKFPNILKFYINDPSYSIFNVNHTTEHNDPLMLNTIDFSLQLYELKNVNDFLLEYTDFSTSDPSTISLIEKSSFKKSPSNLFTDYFYPSHAKKYLGEWFENNFYLEKLGYVNEEDLSPYGLKPQYFSKEYKNNDKNKNVVNLNLKQNELINLLDINILYQLIEKFILNHQDISSLVLRGETEERSNPFSNINKVTLNCFKDLKKSISSKKAISFKSYCNNPKVWNYLKFIFLYQSIFKDFMSNIKKKLLVLKLIIKNKSLISNDPSNLFEKDSFDAINKLINNEFRFYSFLPSIVFNSLYVIQALLEIDINQTSLPPSPPAIQDEDQIKPDDPNMNQRNEILPIDQYREVILKRIEEDRVTIIHGETGCGKSSRIPLFLLDDAEEKKKKIRIIITQPRRIAVINLKNRLSSILKTKVGMRMGHGIKEESVDTKILFVTTGYLVRLMAHNPKSLASVTHLIIDEVHERSIDSDLICWLAKRSIRMHTNLRLILMSATIHSNMYRDYFAGCSGLDLAIPEDCTEDRKNGIPQCLSVGVKRFPVNIMYLEDVLSYLKGTIKSTDKESIGHKISTIFSTSRNYNNISSLLGDLRNKPLASELKKPTMTNQYELVYSLVTTLATMGSSVLVFVAGIQDIEEIQLKFEGHSTFRVIGIHTDIPFEEQQEALNPAQHNEIKVIVATNAAESSVTLPNMDLVLCLGTQKSMVFSPTNAGRSELISSWISKSSATQRAGRTGRIRSGTVIRLYTKDLYESFTDFNEAEITSKPLHDVVLSLKVIFSSHGNSENDLSVTNILQELVEPPSMDNLTRAFKYLHNHDMISDPSDEGKVTSLGTLAGHLPIGVLLSKLVAYGVSLGIGVEAGVLAMALCQSKSLFRVPHSIAHNNPDQFNSIAYQNFFGSLYFYNNLYSDSLVYLKVFFIFKFFQLNRVNSQKIYDWCSKYNIIYSRVKLFYSTTKNFLYKLKELLGNPSSFNEDFYIIPPQYLTIKTLPFGQSKHIPNHSVKIYNKKEDVTNLNPIVLNRLRLIILWSLYSNLLVSKDSSDTNMSIQVPTKIINDNVTKYFHGLKRSINFNVSYTLPGLLSVQASQILLNILSICVPGTSSSSQSFSVGFYSYTLLDEKNTSIQVTKKKNKTISDVYLVFSVKNLSEAIRLGILSNTHKLLKCKTYYSCRLSTMFHNCRNSNLTSTHILDSLFIVYHFIDIDRTALTKLSKTVSSFASFALNSNESNDSTTLSLYGMEWSEGEIYNLYDTIYLTSKLKTNIGKSIDKAVKTSNGLIFSDGINEEQFDFSLDIFGNPQKNYIITNEKEKNNKNLSSPYYEITNTLRLLSNETLPKPFFKDLPYGLRLYNSYSLNQRKGNMKVFIPYNKEQVASETKKLIPGSKEWYLNKNKVEAEENDQMNSNLFGGSVDSLNQKPFSAAWKLINISDKAYKTDEEINVNSLNNLDSYQFYDAIISRTFLAYSRYLPDLEQIEAEGRKITTETTTYAVSNNVIGAGKKLICEGVTIFPPGDEWISSGLKCIGVNLNNSTELYLDGFSCKYGNNVIVCEIIFDMLAGLKSNYIVDQPKLYKTIDELFFRFNELYED